MKLEKKYAKFTDCVIFTTYNQHLSIRVVSMDIKRHGGVQGEDHTLLVGSFFFLCGDFTVGRVHILFIGNNSLILD
jgi:hypothetical protein